MGGSDGYSFTPVCQAGVGQGTLYDQFHTNVKGDSPIHDNASVFKNLAEEYGQHQQSFTTALAEIKTTYTGSAADSMQSAFDPLVKSMGAGQTMTQQAATALSQQAGQFTATQGRINKTVPVPAEPWYEPIDPWDTDHDKAVKQNNEINSANNAAYQAYAGASGANVQSFPRFSAGSTMSPSSISVSSTPVGSVGHGSDGYGGFGSGSNGGGAYSPAHVSGGPGGGGDSYQPGSGSGQDQPAGGQNQPGWNTPPGNTSTNLQGVNSGGGGYPPGGAWSYPGTSGSSSGGGSTGAGPSGFGGFPVTGGSGVGPGDSGGYGPGRGGAGPGGTRSSIGAGAAAAGAGGTKPGAGTAAGVGAGEEGGRMSGAVGTTAGARGAAGSNGMMAGPGRSGKKDEDQEHKSAAYLVTDENEIVGDLPATLPPGGVIGG